MQNGELVFVLALSTGLGEFNTLVLKESEKVAMLKWTFVSPHSSTSAWVGHTLNSATDKFKLALQFIPYCLG